MKIKILTLNCFGPPITGNRNARFPLIASEVEKLSPDIACLQEVIFNKNNNQLKNYFLKKGWKYYFDNQKLINYGGLAIASKRIELSPPSFSKFNDQGGPLNYLLGDAVLGKGYQITIFNVGKKRIVLVNTHLMYLYNIWKRSRERQMHQLDQLINTIKSLEYDHLIMAGDFNIENPDSDSINYLKNQLKIEDIGPKNKYTIDPKNLNRKGKLISIFSDGNSYKPDYLLISKNIRANNVNVVFNNPVLNNGKYLHISDHFGISADLEV